MKNLFSKSIFLVVILFSFFTTNVIAQGSFQELSNQSDLVIEGIVTHQETYKDHTKNRIYTKSTIRIRKNFKGQIHNREIYLRTWGGTYQNERQNWSHHFSIGKKEEGIFFLRKIEPTNEYQIVHPFNGFIAFRNYSGSHPKGYSLTQTFQNIESDIYNPLQIITGKREIVELNDYEQSLFEQTISLTSNECVEYKISDLSITTTNNLSSTSNVFLEFDIDIKALQAAFDLRRTELVMEYSTSILGDSIVSKNNIQVILGGDFGNYSLQVHDEAFNKVGVNIEKIQNLLAIEVNNYHSKLYHATIEIQNFDLNAILQLSVDENFDLKTFKEEGTTVTEISCNEFNENVNIVLNQIMQPVITDFNSPITAGTKSVLTITGENLYPNSGPDPQVWFSDAEYGPSTGWVRPLSSDYLPFTDLNTIRVYVPSYGPKTAPFGNDNNGYAGSGEFKVVHINSNGDVVDESTPQNITIRYTTDNTPQSNNTLPVFLTRKDASNGYTVRYSDAFRLLKDNQSRDFSDAFERALDTWCMTRGLNFNVDSSPIQPGDIYDILIDADDFGGILTGASTGITYFNTACGVDINNNTSSFPNQSPNHPINTPADFIQSATITFNSNAQLFNSILPFWNAGSISNLSFNVEQAALHELGHAHGILHTLQANELMYFDPTAPNGSATITPETKEASEYLINHSSNISFSSANGPIDIKTSCTTSTHSLLDKLPIKIEAGNNWIAIKNHSLIPINNIRIFSLEGKLLQTFNSENLKSQKIFIPNNFSSGLYLISLDTEQGLVTQKFTYFK